MPPKRVISILSHHIKIKFLLWHISALVQWNRPLVCSFIFYCLWFKRSARAWPSTAVQIKPCTSGATCCHKRSRSPARNLTSPWFSVENQVPPLSLISTWCTGRVLTILKLRARLLLRRPSCQTNGCLRLERSVSSSCWTFKKCSQLVKVQRTNVSIRLGPIWDI